LSHSLKVIWSSIYPLFSLQNVTVVISIRDVIELPEIKRYNSHLFIRFYIHISAGKPTFTGMQALFTDGTQNTCSLLNTCFQLHLIEITIINSHKLLLFELMNVTFEYTSKHLIAF
jgi:hypothetical protein